MFGWFEKSERDESVESQLAEMTGVDDMLIHAVRFSGEKLQNIFERASKNETINRIGKVALCVGGVVLSYGLARSNTFGLIGGGSMTLLSLVPVFMAQVGKSKLASEIKQAGLDRLVGDYRIRMGLPETLTFDAPRTGGQANKMTVT